MKELAIHVVRSATIVQEGNVQHGNQDALINPNVGLREHEIKSNSRRERKRALARLFLQIRQPLCGSPGPLYGAVGAHPDDAQAKVITLALNHATGYSPGFWICVHPAAEKLGRPGPNSFALAILLDSPLVWS